MACRKNFERLGKLVNVAGDQDIAALNIMAFNSLGTLKTHILQKFGKEYPHFPGVTLVMLPLVPSNGHSSKNDPGAAIGASGAEQMEDGEGSGSDP